MNPVIIENGTSSPYSFAPIEQIARHDADTLILFLSGNGVLFSQPSGDQWYRVAPTSTKFIAYGANYESTAQLYLPLEPASPLGCTRLNISSVMLTVANADHWLVNWTLLLARPLILIQPTQISTLTMLRQRERLDLFTSSNRQSCLMHRTFRKCLVTWGHRLCSHRGI